MKKIRVAFFADVLRENLDGVTYTLYNIIARIPRDRFEYLFITPFPPSDIKNFPFPVVVCHFIKFPLQKEYPLAFPFYDKKVAKALEDFKPDIVHFTSPTFLGRYALNYARRAGIPVVSTYHTHYTSYVDYYFKNIPVVNGLVNRLVKHITCWFYQHCDLTYVPTAPIRDELVSYGIGADRFMIWGRGIETDKHHPGNRDEAYIDALCGAGTFRILFVSRLYWIKEIKTLHRLYQLINKAYPQIKMVITGDGPQEKWMKKRMPNAVFTGKLIDDDLQRIYASCDLFVFPSVTETFGNVVLEALASGLPVVAAAQGGPKGIVQDGVTGYHVTPMDAADFRDRIVYLMNNRGVLKAMSRAAVEYSRTQRWDILCSRMFDSYEKIIAAAPSDRETDTHARAN